MVPGGRELVGLHLEGLHALRVQVDLLRGQEVTRRLGQDQIAHRPRPLEPAAQLGDADSDLIRGVGRLPALPDTLRQFLDGNSTVGFQ
jgi:hypothetical protein